MPISAILINVRDIQRSVDFYTTHLGAQLVGEVTRDRADLDLVTATVHLARTEDSELSTWIPDDLQKGFRHVGFKVAAVDPMVAELDAAGVEFHLRPIDAAGGVRIAFFFDPDGTLLELVEGDVKYHDVHDVAAVERERSLGAPSRPTFDHLGVTAASLASISERYRSFGFGLVGSLHHTADPRGFEIDYLRGGQTILEVFTFAATTVDRPIQTDAAGFAGLTIAAGDGGHEGTSAALGRAVGTDAYGIARYADPDGLLVSVAP
jgi:catechol 2,3-dioxygenase-like lactoylglutathione lyase family enzyme